MFWRGAQRAWVAPASSAAALSASVLWIKDNGAAASVCEGGVPASSKTKQARRRVVIIGGGVMGASTAWALSSRTKEHQSLEVTLIDANHPIRGSWHESRIARAAYEDKMYVAGALRALDHWRRLEGEAGKGKLVHMTGILDIGEPEKLKQQLGTYLELGMPVEVYEGSSDASLKAFKSRFPTIGLGPDQQAIYQADTAVLLADVCVQAMLDLAENRGARILSDDAVVSIDRTKKVVKTAKGVEVGYDALILCAGPWTNQMLNMAGLRLLPLVISNEQAVYLQPKPGHVDGEMEPGVHPVVVEHDANIYAVPHLPGGVAGCKIGAHAAGELMDNEEFLFPAGATGMLGQIEQPSKQLHEEQSDHIHDKMLAVVQNSARLTFPLLDPTTGADTYTRCLYQNIMRNNTAEGKMSEFSSDIACGPHPDDRSVLVTAGYTGEGFKFGPVLGELLADMVTGETVERVPGMRRRFAIDNGSLDLFPPLPAHKKRN